jgi:hypothetical protein
MLKSIFLLLFSIFLVQSPEQYQQQSQLTGLNLSVKKLNYYVAEPVYVTASLSNNQDKSVKANFDRLVVYYRKSDDDFISYFRERNVFIGINFMELEAHGSVERSECLLYDPRSNQFVLNDSGTYEIKATLTVEFPDGRQEVYESDVTKINVLDPPNNEKSALMDLKTHQIPMGLFLNGLDLRVEYKNLDDMIEKAAIFVRTHRTSFYAPLVTRQLKLTLTEINQQNNGNLSPKLGNIYNMVKNLPDVQIPQ